MKLAIVHPSNVLRQALEMVTSAFGHEMTNPEEAELIICANVDQLVPFLQAGKTVVQFITPGDRIARGLLTAPEYEGRFFVFGVISHPEFPEIPQLLAFLKERGEGGKS